MRIGRGRERGNYREGMTLVELLIVMIIVGILAGAMTLASFSATDKALAARISAEIRSMKTAALIYYNDHDRWPTWVFDGSGYRGGAADYLDREPVCDQYWLGVVENSSDHSVAVIMGTESLDSDVKRHLAGMAVEMGYYQGGSGHSVFDDASMDYFAEDGDYDNADSLICFIIHN